MLSFTHIEHPLKQVFIPFKALKTPDFIKSLF